MIRFELAEENGWHPKGWYAADLSIEHPLVNYDIKEDYYTGRGVAYIPFPRDDVWRWLSENVGDDDWQYETDGPTGLTLYMKGHANVMAFMMRWG